MAFCYDMKTKLIFIGLILMITSCAAFKKEIVQGPSIVGVWQEYVLNDSSLNLLEKNIVKISKTDDFYQMESMGTINYSYSHIHLTDNNFTFQRSHTSESNLTSIVAYNLFVNADYTFMKGTSYSDQGLTLEIEYRLILVK
ncbi:MAG: hypothetical protein IPO32_06115 [Crocinitomicaceae bacterium]|nr:hypothetical protein [Crocinitomicaceae bacterium]